MPSMMQNKSRAFRLGVARARLALAGGLAVAVAWGPARIGGLVPAMQACIQLIQLQTSVLGIL